MTVSNTPKQPVLGRPKSAAKRQQILRSAGELLLSLGYSNTSMEALAKHSGVSKQTVYSHFNNKEALFNAVIESKCKMYQVEEASVCIDTQPLRAILSSIGLSLISLLKDDNVIAMYKVVIGESKQDSSVGQLFYEAGPLHSINMVSELLQKHPQSQLSEAQAYEASIDFFNLLKSDYHMRGILHLPYELTQAQQQGLANTVARKTIALLAVMT